MKQVHAYVLDLTLVQGDGEFKCPKCGVTISPEDETNEVYSVLDAKVEKQNLKTLVIQCSRCESQIHLTGFSLLQKLGE
jgi:predicted nucleic-acid-binding Zn-ribbon protein